MVLRAALARTGCLEPRPFPTPMTTFPSADEQTVYAGVHLYLQSSAARESIWELESFWWPSFNLADNDAIGGVERMV